ncbi:MAG: hypothetical protein NC827_04650 [Candidatus Omnitrophica bacterium]|nr:hypothetical protein [Candidatus Omnitrophota bacterium]MCM8802582.1 hypothetical protein [Candidatus Omnitrophota bacterium]
MRKILFILFFLISFSFSANVKIGQNREILIDDKPFFPIMSWVQPVALFEENIKIGVNVFVGQGARGEKPKEFLDACQKMGVYGAISIHSVEQKNIVSELKDHPALLFWWLPDEPDNYGRGKLPKYTPEEIKELYEMIKSIDKEHPVFVNFGSGLGTGSLPIPARKYFEYIPYCDGLTTTGSYPENAPGEPKEFFNKARAMRYLVRFDTTKKKPLGQWIGLSYIGAETQNPDPTARGPKPEEVKAQIWMCIVEGATSIGFFPHSWSTPENPNVRNYTQFRVTDDVKKEVKRITDQIKELTPVILSSDSAKKVNLINLEETDVNIRVKEKGDEIYIFASNTRPREGKVKFEIDQSIKVISVKVYGENREIKNQGNNFEDTFKTYEPHIYIVKFSK